MFIKSKIESEVIVDKAMTFLGLRLDMKTDPKITQDVLKEMRLDDLQTSFLPMKNFLSEIILEPQEMGSMFQNIKDGIVNKHPAIVEFLELALEKNWLNGGGF